MYNEESFYFILPKIRQLPGLYLGKKSLEALMHYWRGYAFGIEVKTWEHSSGRNFFENYDDAVSAKVNRIPYNQHFMYGFDQFIQSRYKVSLGSLSAATFILQESSSDEEAFDTFFELLDEFFNQSGKTLLGKDIDSL